MKEMRLFEVGLKGDTWTTSYEEKFNVAAKDADEAITKALEPVQKAFEERIAKAEKITLGALIARGGKAGVTLEGSPIAVLADTAASFAIDRALTLRAGLLGEKTLTTQSVIQRRQGQIAKVRGKATRRASLLKAGGIITTTVGASGIGTGGGNDLSQLSTKAGRQQALINF